MKRIPFKRRRQQLTDYKKRLRLVSSGKTRFVVRVSNKYITCQFIDYEQEGDVTLVGFNSKQLSNYGFNGSKNLQSAYLSGYAAGKMALTKGVKQAILDIGLQRSVKNSRIYSALKGVVEAGIKVPYSEGVLPDNKLLKKDELVKVIKKINKELGEK